MAMTLFERYQLCNGAICAMRHGKERLAGFPGLLKLVIQERAWEERKVPSKGIIKLASLRELVTTKPIIGWGEDPSKIEAVIKDDPEVLAMWREEMTGEPHRPKKEESHDNIMTSQGTSKSYTVSRLKRERPDLFKRVVDKELSANAAAIEAGWRKKLSDLEQALRFYERLSPQERVEFFAKIGKP